MQEWARYMREANYQKVTVKGVERPLLYILWDQSQLKWQFGDDLANVRQGLDYLSGLLAGDRLGRPYVVILDGEAGADIVPQIGADAISNYIAGHKLETKGPYTDLDMQAQEYWSSLAGHGVPIVPIAQVGWDTRARQEIPGPWGPNGTFPAPVSEPTQYYALPTPSELASHIKAAVHFIDTRPSVCPSRVLLIYSWDECDEGGGLIPTLGDPKGSYLSAIAPIIS